MQLEDFIRLKRALGEGENIESVQWADDYEGYPHKVWLHLSTSEPIGVFVIGEDDEEEE